MVRKKELDEKKIIEMYLDRKMSSYKIAKIMDCSNTYITNCLKKKGIPRRNNSEARIGLKMKPYTIEQRKRRSERIKQDYINHPEMKESRSKQFRKDLDEEKMIQLYKTGISAERVGKILGVSQRVILKRLEKNNVPRRSGTYYNRHPLSTSDGHLVKSSPEKEIDNFLFENKIQHIYDRNIADTKYRYDFYLPEFNLYIEYFGVEDNFYYNQKTSLKIKLYSELGMNLLSIYPKDNIQEKLNIILEAKKQEIKEIKIISKSL